MSSDRPIDGRGLLFIVSAPSGAGKTTVVERLVEQTPRLKMSRSYTSRPAREGETDGVDYNFVTRHEFERMAAAGHFLEWADVFGNLYGTSLADTERVLESSTDLVLVWNDLQAREAEELHGISPERIRITGAPVCDPWFEWQPSRSRARRKRRTGAPSAAAAAPRRSSMSRSLADVAGLVMGRMIAPDP